MRVEVEVEQVAVEMQTEALGKQKIKLCRMMFRVFGVVMLSVEVFILDTSQEHIAFNFLHPPTYECCSSMFLQNVDSQ
jgi:hypothetical protein